MPEATTPEELLASFAPEVRELAERLRRLLRSAVPGATERAYPGWRGVGYHDAQAGYFAGIFPRSASVRLLFERGASLPDPGGLFTGGGSQTRWVELRPGEAVPEEAIREMLDAALRHGSVR